MKDLFLTKCLTVSPLINSSLKSSPVSIQPGDSCINQLLSITHEIFASFDNGLEVKSVFLDISKALDKVWHERLTFKWKQNYTSGELLHILSDALSNRKQRVVLDGQNSSWTNVHAWVPQGYILDPLLFLIYINELSDNLTSNAKLFVANTSLFLVVHDVNTSAKELNDDLKKVNDWACENGKRVSILIRANKLRKLFSVANQRGRASHL